MAKQPETTQQSAQKGTAADRVAFVVDRGDGTTELLEIQASATPLDAAALPGWFVVRSATLWIAARVVA